MDHPALSPSHLLQNHQSWAAMKWDSIRELRCSTAQERCGATASIITLSKQKLHSPQHGLQRYVYSCSAHFTVLRMIHATNRSNFSTTITECASGRTFASQMMRYCFLTLMYMIVAIYMSLTCFWLSSSFLLLLLYCYCYCFHRRLLLLWWCCLPLTWDGCGSQGCIHHAMLSCRLHKVFQVLGQGLCWGSCDGPDGHHMWSNGFSVCNCPISVQQNQWRLPVGHGIWVWRNVIVLPASSWSTHLSSVKQKHQYW